MIINVTNEDFGYSVTCQGRWAAVGNPSSLRFDPLTSSLIRTGSVEVYRYNINSDIHDKKTVLYRPPVNYEQVLLATETDLILHTELTGNVPFTSDLDLRLDDTLYFTASEDGYGFAVDIHQDLLAVGCPYFRSQINVSQSFIFTGSGQVDLFDLSKLNIDPFASRQTPIITGTSLAGGLVQIEAFVPASQSFGFVLLESKLTSSVIYQKVNVISISDAGGNVTIPTNYTDSSSLDFRVTGIISTDPFLVTVFSPTGSTTSSFGYSVSLNDEWLAVGSPFESSSKGAVFLYQKQGESNASWSLYQTISPPSDIVSGDEFGFAVDLNKSTGSYSGSLVIGSLKPTSSKAYVYELSASVWINTFTLSPDNTTIYPLTFYPTLPLFSGSFPNTADSFGRAVAINKDTIVVGAPKDRAIYEYSGSSVYYQGAAYFFQRCVNPSRGYYLANKSYGNEKTMNNNLLGYSVDVFGSYATVGCPKLDISSSTCFLRGSLFQQHFCDAPLEDTLDGQFILYQMGTGSIPDTTGIGWDIVNVYQIKKRILQPYRDYGFDVAVSEQFVVVGAPMIISGSNRVMDMNPNTGSFTGSLSDIGDLNGKAYIYNLKNLRDQFYVGNVFYRNGKIVIMASGSAFDGLLLNTVSGNEVEYDINFRSKQLLYEKQIVCPVDVGEFNVSTNPTAIFLPTSSFDINQNGKFDFQDVDVLLRYMKYKSSEASGTPITDWSSSVLNTITDEELSVYAMYSASWTGTDTLFTENYSSINNKFATLLDFNQDNKIDINDMSILWRYFIYRLTQKNYETYITPNSTRKFLSDIIDYMNTQTSRNVPPMIVSEFANYGANAKSDPTGSFLAPYVTTVGLYDGAELVAVAKLGSPIKVTPDFPINFVVKIDF